MPILALREEQGLTQLMKVGIRRIGYGHFSSCSNSVNLHATTTSKLNDSPVNLYMQIFKSLKTERKLRQIS